MTRYYDSWRSELQQCRHCKWSGLGSELPMGDVFTGVTEMNCPICTEKVLNVAQPTFEDVRANWDRADEADKKQVESGEQMAAEFERRKLSTQDQLPDIDAPAFVLVLDDLEGSHDRVIRYGDRVIHSEPRYWEDWERYGELAKIVREKYGHLLLDLVPTGRCYENLWGDKLAAPNITRAVRREIFGWRAPVDGKDREALA